MIFKNDLTSFIKKYKAFYYHMFMCAQCVSVGGMGDTIMRYKHLIY